MVSVMSMGTAIKSADWQTEKHVPVIQCPDTVEAGQVFDVEVSVGREIAHPNTTEHHIRWIKLFFQEDGRLHHVGTVEFSAHGESPEGPNTGPVYTDHGAVFRMRTSRPGRLLALSYCNIHGLWESEKVLHTTSG